MGKIIKNISLIIDRTGETHITNEGYIIKIIGYRTNMDCNIMFDDGVILHKVAYHNIKNGLIRNPNHRSICDIGFLGVGEYKPTDINNKFTKSYASWVGMMHRCYNKNSHIKNPSYIDCEVCSDWHNYQTFSLWFYNNNIDGFTLDKDILFKGNRTYSPDTCCFVPKEINSLFTSSNKIRGIHPIGVSVRGNKFQVIITINKIKRRLGSYYTSTEAFKVYKNAKEEHIKNVANKWKNKGITQKTYDIMMKYEVDISD